MKNVVILNNYPYIKKQVKALLEPHGINVYEASTSLELYNELANTKIDLIILDVLLHEKNGFELIKEIKEKHIDAPFIILTTADKRDIFVKGIQEGAIDYILLPFNEEQFLSKMNHHLFPIRNTHKIKEELTPDFQKYLRGELAKAKKGNYSLAISISTLFRPVKNLKDEFQNDECSSLSDKLYKGLKDLFWDTDLVVRYGSESFIGIFPFSTEENNSKINTKLTSKFLDTKNHDSKFEFYNLESVFVTYPKDGEEQEVLIDKLILNMKHAIDSRKNIVPVRNEQLPQI